MPTADDSRTLVPLPAADISELDRVLVFHAASNSTRATPASELATTTETVLAALETSGSIIVNNSGTDLQRGDALVAAYAAAKLLTPNGAALSANNRATVVIPTGRYKLTATLVLDTDFIDLLALLPTKPARRTASDFDAEVVTDLSVCRAGPTEVYTEVASISTISQTCDDARLFGFAITQLATDGAFFDLPEYGAFLIGQGSSNAPSVYQDMYFYNRTVSFLGAGGVRAYTNFSGTWINCVANGASFRNGFGVGGVETATFSAKMYDCEAGVWSYVGDYPNPDSKPNYTVQNAHFERCKAIGTSWEESDNGANSFAGCTGSAVHVYSNCYFIDCAAGNRSFGIGALNEGNYYRCTAGTDSFGGNAINILDEGDFAGYAEDCTAGARSFGGAQTSGLGRLSGTLVRCVCTGNTVTTRLEGATIRDCRFTATTTGIHLFTLMDNNSTISNSDLIVLQGGAGIPIYAASAKNVSAYHLRMNNVANDADGLHANVTNLVTTPYNVISASVQ